MSESGEFEMSSDTCTPAAQTTDTTAAAADTGSTRTASSCAANPAEAERQLRELEDEWNRAGTARDAAFFERVLADEFITTGGAETQTKAQYIAGIRDTTRAGATSPQPQANLSDTRVRVFGDVAIVSGLATFATTPPRRRRYTEVFVCRAGQWQAAHRHANTVSETGGG